MPERNGSDEGGGGAVALFGILGPIEVTRHGRPVALGGARPRALLAVLLLSANRVASTDRLISDLWGQNPPAQTLNALQTHISKLRGVLEPDRGPREPARLLRSQTPGYVLTIEPGALDAKRFEAAAAAGREELREGRPAVARQQLVQALSLWRGRALAEVADQPFARAEAERLEDLRSTVLEDRLSADLALGEHSAVAAEVRQLLEQDPLRERLWEQLMMALYRSGRQAEALAAYQRCRTVLRDELGLEPNPSLQRLEHDILEQAPVLDWQPPVRSGEPAVAASPEQREPIRTPAAPGRFVGRTRALDILGVAWAEASNGRGGMVLLSGDAGIGKTRLAEEIADRAASAGALVAWARCPEDSGAPVLWPWRQVLEALVGDAVPDAVREALDRAGFDVADLAPLLPSASGSAADGAGLADARGARFRVCQAVTTALGAVAAGEPVLVVVDDLQWADAATLQLLETLVVAAASVPLLVVATSRDQQVADDPLANTLGILAREPAVRRVPLERFEPDEVATFVTQELEEDVPPEVVASLDARTGGNPFFLRELTHLLASEGLLHDRDAAHHAAVPAGVADVIRRRVARLPIGAEPALVAAAVIGDDFDLLAVEAAAELPAGTGLDVLDGALRAGLIAKQPRGVARFSFSHSLVREAIYEHAGTRRAAHLHARVADILSTRHGSDSAGALAVAHHYLRAVDVVGPEVVLPPVLAASEVAAAQLGFEQAEGLLEQVLLLIDLLPHDGDMHHLEIEARGRLAMIHARTKGFTAAETAEQVDRRRRLGDVAEVRDDRIASQYLSFVVAWATCDVARASELADAIVQMTHAIEDSVGVFVNRSSVGLVALQRGELDAARSALEQAVLAADDLPDAWLHDSFVGDPRILIRCLAALAMALAADSEAGQTMARETLVTARTHGNRLDIDQAVMLGAHVAFALRDVQATRRLTDDAVTERTGQSVPQALFHTYLFGAWARAMDGEAEAAAELLAEHRRLRETAGLSFSQSLEAFATAEIQHLVGDDELALRTIEDGLAAIENNGERMYGAELHRLRAQIVPVGQSGRVNQ